ncbi:FBD-associated F-box protein At5g22730-like [Bidens hawaiensis]|uniref:FBD-associated F-box protein At5g22730-like n=1 Tax=Bidens hawaiensis TaxID=980011 RepID=UPI004049F86A
MMLRSATRKKGLIDHISKMPDDVLLMILSRLIVKDAVVTGSLSTRWKHLWRNSSQLNFDGTETLDKMGDDEMLCDLERRKFIKQVNDVISSHNGMVQLFRIRFELDSSCSECVNEWVQFAIERKVRALELNLLDKSNGVRDIDKNYNFMLPSINAMSLTLKVLILRSVNLNEPTLNAILKNSPLLEGISMFGSILFRHIRFGGRGINLKKFQLVACSGIESVSLFNFDLKFFQYHGQKIELHLTDLPKLAILGFGDTSVGLENNVFRKISFCASYLEDLLLEVRHPEKKLDDNAILKFPNVKKLKLAVGAEEDNCLLEFMSIAQACPRLETFSISLIWLSPLKRRRKVRRVVAPEGHRHLKIVEINGYPGRISNLELAVYAIDNAVALKDIIIVPGYHSYGVTTYEKLKRERAARSAAKRQITPLLPPGVNLAIL